MILRGCLIVVSDQGHESCRHVDREMHPTHVLVGERYGSSSAAGPRDARRPLLSSTGGYVAGTAVTTGRHREHGSMSNGLARREAGCEQELLDRNGLLRDRARLARLAP